MRYLFTIYQGFSQILLPIYTLFPAAPARMPPFSCNTSTHPAPLNPLSRGETSTPQITHYRQESSARTSPLERGRGCVTPEQSHLKPKTVTQSPRNTTSPNSGKNTSAHTAPLTVTHPSIPSREGKPPHHKPLITNKKATPEPPRPKEGSGVCDPRAKPPQTQNGHPKPKKHHLAKQRQKHFSPHRTSHRNTPLNPLSRGETYTP